LSNKLGQKSQVQDKPCAVPQLLATLFQMPPSFKWFHS